MYQTHRVKTAALLAACLVLNAARVAYAQSATGNVNGTVTDPTSASVAGARLLLRNHDTGIKFAFTISKSASRTKARWLLTALRRSWKVFVAFNSAQTRRV